jgi:N utilization substance protein B
MSNIKSLQRLLVVQTLYQLSINQDTKYSSIKDIFKEVINISEYRHSIHKSNLNFAEKIFEGVQDNLDQIDKDLSQVLSIKKKIDPLLLAIFKPAIYELKYGSEISKKIVISEYLMIADKFFSEKEIGLLNGVLDNI